MNIRYGTTADAKMLSELGAKTFYDTFAKDNTPENMAAHLNSFSPEIQLAELTNPNYIFLIAEQEKQPIGYTQLVLDYQEEFLTGIKPLEVRRIYTIQEYIGKGVGKALMQAAIHEAQQRGCDSVWLVFGKKIQGQSSFIRSGALKKSAHIFLPLAMIRNETL